MMQALVAWSATVCLYAHAHPPACQTDDQCQSGFYCDQDSFGCHRCLDCEQLKRDSPLVPSACIKSVAECGPCVTGFVENIREAVDWECVVPAAGDEAAIPAYVWAAVSVGLLLLFALVVAIVVYVLRNTENFKILASTRASFQSPSSIGSCSGAASAPELPPPYHAHYSAVRPSSPPAPAAPASRAEHSAEHDAEHSCGEESSWPFIKRSPSGLGARREAAGSQAARVYNKPNYVRGPHVPPSYEGAGTGPASAGSAASVEEEPDVFATDEDTMESTWTPAPSDHANGNANGVASGALSAQLEAARGTALIRAPLHPPCSWQDTNNNRNASDSHGAGEGSTSAGGPSFVINVMQTFNTLQQTHAHKEPRC